MTARLQHRASWWAGAVIVPVVLIGALLGVVTSADTALERIPVALVNNDELIEEINEEGEEKIILASRPLVTELVSNEDFGVEWVITGTEQADALLASGEVYAVVEIPEDFSQAVTTLDDSDPVQAEFTIRTDPSHSYLASVLADQLGQTIATTISAEFGRSLTEGLFTAIVDLGDGFSEAADGAEEIAEATEELAEGITELKDGSEDLTDGAREAADGYVEFDDGLDTYFDGVRKIADGLEEFNEDTEGLPALADGVGSYTEGVGDVGTGLDGLNEAGTFAGIPDPDQTTLQTLIATLNALSTSGATLAKNLDTAIDGVRTGIVETDKGADALAEGTYPIAEGSDGIRSGLIDFADGVEEFDEGIGDLEEGSDELAEGMNEFAEGLREGADDIAEEGTEEPSESTLDAITSPIAFSENQAPETIGFQETLTSVFIPVALWFVALIATLRLPTLGHRVLGSTAPTGRIFTRLVAPVLGTVGIQAVVAVVLMHTLGGLGWADLGWSVVLVASTSLAFSAVHYLLWLWRPGLLAPLSITAGIVQVITVGALIPLEALPGVYQTIGGLGPMAWSADGLIAAIAGADPGRIVQAVVGLVTVAAAALTVSHLALARARARAVEESLGLTHSV